MSQGSFLQCLDEVSLLVFHLLLEDGILLLGLLLPKEPGQLSGVDSLCNLGSKIENLLVVFVLFLLKEEEEENMSMKLKVIINNNHNKKVRTSEMERRNTQKGR